MEGARIPVAFERARRVAGMRRLVVLSLVLALGAVFAPQVDVVGAEGLRNPVITHATESSWPDSRYAYDGHGQPRGRTSSMSRGGSQLESSYPGTLVRLPDGTTVGLRGASRSGGPTVDARLPGGQTVKVHVDPWPPAG